MSNNRVTTLPNGIKIITEHISYVKSFSLGFWFNSGARDETDDNNGISHFIEHMVFKGTKKRSAKRISEEIESVGGYLNAFTSKEHTCFYGRGLAQNIGKTFNVISDMVLNPLFRDKDIIKEASVILDELNDINDNPEELIFDKFEELIFNGSSLGLPIIGTERNITNFNSDILHSFHKERYSTGELLVVASGLVNHDEIVKLTEKTFVDNFKFSPQARKINDENFASNLIIEKEIQQVHCIIGRKTYGFDNPKRFPLILLSNALGEGSSSRLFQAVREKRGITYQINSFLNSFSDASAFGVYFSTNEKHVDKVVSIIAKEFQKFRDVKVSQRELQRVKEYVKGGLILSLENTTNRMIRIAHSFLYFDKFIPIEEIIQKIDAITPEQISEIANEVLDNSHFSKVIIKSTNKKLNKAA